MSWVGYEKIVFVWAIFSLSVFAVAVVFRSIPILILYGSIGLLLLRKISIKEHAKIRSLREEREKVRLKEIVAENEAEKASQPHQKNDLSQM
jgi:hypothetical protein